jgi:two-component system sensor histidine kinase ResE
MDRKETAAALSVVGHELTGPLASARFHLELVRRQLVDSPEPARRLEVVDHQLERMGRLVGDLLDAQRLVHGRLHCELAVHELAGLLRQCMTALTPLAGERTLELIVPKGARLHARVDPSRLEQVLANLIRNAARHSPEGTAITVRLGRGHHRRRRTALISVRDRGSGIARDVQRRIFEPWFSRSPGGLGLGLTIARCIMQTHGGDIRAHSMPRRGTTMSFWLPLVEDRATLKE